MYLQNYLSSLDLIQKIENVNNSDIPYLVSFDVFNVFPGLSYPEECLEILRKLFFSTHNQTFQDLDILTPVVDIILEQNLFQFNNEIYTQDDLRRDRSSSLSLPFSWPIYKNYFYFYF